MHEITVGPEALDAWRVLEGEAAAGRAMRYSPLQPARTALVVVDMQNAFCLAGNRSYLPAAVSIIPNINALAAAVRGAGGAVVWIQQTYRNDEERFAVPEWRRQLFPQFEAGMAQRFERGTHSHALHADMDVQPGDIRIEKTRWGCFMPQSSELHETLQARGIDTVIVCGVATDACVETTVREAVMLDYKAMLVVDASATDSDEHHNAAITTLNHMYLPDVVYTRTVLAELAGT